MSIIQTIKSILRWSCMPLYFGGGGGSSTSTTNTQNIDKRQVTDNGATAISADHSTITMTDNGAVKAALDSTSNNFAVMVDAVKVLGNGAVQAINSNTQLTRDLATSTASAYSDAASQASGNKNLVYAGMAVLAVVGLAMMKKG